MPFVAAAVENGSENADIAASKIAAADFNNFFNVFDAFPCLIKLLRSALLLDKPSVFVHMFAVYALAAAVFGVLPKVVRAKICNRFVVVSHPNICVFVKRGGFNVFIEHR